MDGESIEHKAFIALLSRLEEEPTDALLIEIAREIEKGRRDKHAPLRQDRESLLEEVRSEIIAVLGRILQEGKRNAFLRMEAAEILGKFEVAAPIAVPALVGGLRDEVSFVRVAACEALEKIGVAARSAVDPLRETARDLDPDVRRAATKALEMITEK